MVINKEMLDKTVYKIGEMVVDSKQVFWKARHCYALIPIVQLLDGHVLLTPRRQVAKFTDLEPVEVFDIGLTTKLLTKGMENFEGVNSTTIEIQSCNTNDGLQQLVIHIIPRKPNDLKTNNELYDLLNKYPATLIKQYREKMNFYVNIYANKILDSLQLQAKKYQDIMNLCYKEEIQG